MVRSSVFAAALLVGAVALPGHAQDAPASASPPAASPPTVATSRPLDDRKPAIGKSIIRFPDHQFEIDGTAVITVADRHLWLVLPAGAPVLPVDPAAMRQQADGRTFYDVKLLGKISVISTTVAKAPSVLPARFLETIVPDETAVTAGSGVLHKGDVLLSVPYTYKSPLRLSEDFAIHNLFGSRLVGVAGETGFDAGSFSGVAYIKRFCACSTRSGPTPMRRRTASPKGPAPGTASAWNRSLSATTFPAGSPNPGRPSKAPSRR